MDRSDFRFFARQRVRWVEVDLQRIVFNGHYLTYIDNAMFDYWRALGLPYVESMQALGGDLYVRKATLEYHASAQLDDLLDIGLKVARLGHSSIVFSAGIFRDQRLLIAGEMVYVFADPEAVAARPIPDRLRASIEGFEAGEAMTRVETGAWSSLGPQAGPLRRAVFVTEQGFSEAEEWDGEDEAAVHAVVTNRLGAAIATGRLLSKGPKVGKIGRMCVAKSLRGGSYGSQVLQALEAAARARGDHTVVLHAQTQAQAFYRRNGYEPAGDVFEEAGAPHIAMRKSL